MMHNTHADEAMLTLHVSFCYVKAIKRGTCYPYRRAGSPPAERLTNRMNDSPPKALTVSQPTLMPLHNPNVLGRWVLVVRTSVSDIMIFVAFQLKVIVFEGTANFLSFSRYGAIVSVLILAR
jgi:hypothetical protein